ncbi:type II toxin-antitoxin system PemK/MazF family toxin [Arthrobacter sp. NPDC056727]|uniref:type II toxin-antitoxin system PemK/MazF family toxin n=1 Tax=Arthrobacter sp. NPDC056727 TaxID=3345927 RepID=UPI00366DB026
MASDFSSIGGAVRSVLRFLGVLRQPPVRTPSPDRGRPENGPRLSAGVTGTYPGDFTGTAALRYSPSPDGRPDPGEIVWTWVPFEEDHSRGKDRPVLLVGSHGKYLLGLMLTSKDHDRHPHARLGYVDIGTGNWDRQGRASEAKLNRVLQIHPADIRREGAVLDRKKFRLVAGELRRLRGWK